MSDTGTRTVTLAGGRRLCLAEFGDPRGTPMFYFHGLVSCRLEARLAGATASRLGVRLIAPDRPGFGGSDFVPRRRITDWPADVSAVAARLKLEHFAVLGISGGAPYALACAHAPPPGLVRTGVVSGWGPLHEAGLHQSMPPPIRRLFALERRLPALGRWLCRRWARGLEHRPERFLQWIEDHAPEADRRLLRQPPVREALLQAHREALRNGIEGLVHECRLLLQPWGFRLQDIAAPVELWHGGQDGIVPVPVGRAVSRRLPRCHAYFLGAEGHFSLPLRHLPEIVSALTCRTDHEKRPRPR